MFAIDVLCGGGKVRLWSAVACRAMGAGISNGGAKAVSLHFMQIYIVSAVWVA